MIPHKQGDEAPRRFLAILSPKDRKEFTNGSGRLELAQSIASADNPLTTRVLVNRVWMYHFGQALVRTPGDFGLRGEKPTHPELLDWLASTFIQQGWSQKKLHRTDHAVECLSDEQCRDSAELRGRPRKSGSSIAKHANASIWKQCVIRCLTVSGQLDKTVGGKAVEIVFPPYSNRRTVYARK